MDSLKFKKVNGMTLAHSAVDIFENFLEEKGVMINNPEKEENKIGAAIIYGSDYGDLVEKINAVIDEFEREEPEIVRVISTGEIGFLEEIDEYGNYVVSLENDMEGFYAEDELEFLGAELDVVRIKNSDQVGFVEDREENGEYLITLDDDSQGWFSEKELEFIIQGRSYDLDANLNTNLDNGVIKNLVLMINDTKLFDCMDIDNEDFIEYVCGKTGLDRDSYFAIMELEDESQGRFSEDNLEFLERTSDKELNVDDFDKVMTEREGPFSELLYERYKQLSYRFNDEEIEWLISKWGIDIVNKGYAEDYVLADGAISDALQVVAIYEVNRFNDYFDACRQAEKDGIEFINDMDGLEKGCYIDTPENRQICKQALDENPDLRVENWLSHNGEYAKKYIAKYGIPAKNKGVGIEKIIKEAQTKAKEKDVPRGKGDMFR